MTLEISNVCSDRVKEVAIRNQGAHCPSVLNIKAENIVLIRSGEDHILVKDIDGPAGVLISKLDIRTMFPGNLDTRPLKGTVTAQIWSDPLPEFVETFVRDFNKEHECDLVGSEHDVLKRPTGYSKELLREFILFCRVYGFWQLDASDLDMSMDDEWLYITVVPTHEHYTGHIKVRI